MKSQSTNRSAKRSTSNPRIVGATSDGSNEKRQLADATNVPRKDDKVLRLRLENVYGENTRQGSPPLRMTEGTIDTRTALDMRL